MKAPINFENQLARGKLSLYDVNEKRFETQNFFPENLSSVRRVVSPNIENYGSRKDLFATPVSSPHYSPSYSITMKNTHKPIMSFDKAIKRPS